MMLLNTHTKNGIAFVETNVDKNFFVRGESERVVDDSQYHPTSEFSQLDTSGSGGEGIYDFYSEEDRERYNDVDLSVLHSGVTLDINEIHSMRKELMDSIKENIKDVQAQEVAETMVEQMTGSDVSDSASADADEVGAKS